MVFSKDAVNGCWKWGEHSLPCKVQSMDDNCGEWVECMGVASGCGEQEVGVASGSGWNLWVWLLGVVLRRYIDFLILLIPTPLVSVLFCSSIPMPYLPSSATTISGDWV